MTSLLKKKNSFDENINEKSDESGDKSNAEKRRKQNFIFYFIRIH